MAFTMYSYFNETTGDLVISGQEETLGDGYAQLDTPSVNPTYNEWPWNDIRGSIKSARIGTISPIDVISTNRMFSNCSNLLSVDISKLDTSNTMDCSWMFQRCASLQSIDLSSLNTKKVIDMSNMFYYCSSLVSLDISSFDLSSTTNTESMFYNCSSLASLNLSSFDTSKVTNIGNMFTDCSNLHIMEIPITATNICTQLPKSTYYDAATGTQYSKTNIPGGSVYVDDLKYTRVASTMIQNREGLLSSKRSGVRRCMNTRKLISSMNDEINSSIDSISKSGLPISSWELAGQAMMF